MEIGKTDTSGIGATVRTLSANTATNTPATSQTPDAKSSGTGGSSNSSNQPPATGSLRTQSPVVLTASEDDSVSKLSPDTFAELVSKKTKAFAKTLTDALKAADIPTDEAVTLRIDGAGRVTADGPYQKRIAEMFENNPELEKQFKDVAALNSLVALNQAMRRHAEAQKNARTDDERDQADADYLRDSLSIQKRSGIMVLADGALTSPAMTYMATGR